MSGGGRSCHAGEQQGEVGAAASTSDAGAMSDFASRRDAMVDYQIVARGIGGDRLLAALRAVPRERFVPENMVEFAYEDSALPIEAGQTISQPYIVALMIEAAAIGPDDRVLEVGVGSGYAAAVMSRMGRAVHAIDRHPELTDRAAERLAALGCHNVTLRTGDGTRGWADAAPFDVILVAAGSPRVPRPLLDQLAPGGRLVIPVGEGGSQRLLRVTRTGASDFREDDLGAVVFVPLIGEHGWPGDPVGAGKARR
ncbi:protein-L-isoaspartate(D-aspartate) O-methyltransferase [Sphingopyxis indica]|uniref:protein-L-isoaspartate(D-aspartate) O-methyltransferase n=1 Tax=Sphingopyxis indica TaxID=436663 RepID=UPI00293912E2|nr:protein-L-isoaspartate(D-aspartate) O-methyltransferase [Sphingopyxis indica]